MIQQFGDKKSCPVHEVTKATKKKSQTGIELACKSLFMVMSRFASKSSCFFVFFFFDYAPIHIPKPSDRHA